MSMKKMMMKKTMLFSTALLLCTPVLLQNVQANETSSQDTAKPVAPYGENPNLLHVFAYKAQEGVINTAEKVGKVAEKGVAKVKPKVDQAWDNTKTTTATTINKVDQGAAQVTQQANQRIQETKDAISGSNSQPAPIEQQPLSQSSTVTQSSVSPPSANTGGATSYAVTDL